MRVRFTPGALRSIRFKRAWWEQNREKNPRLFRQELAAVIAKLRSGADNERRRYGERRDSAVWRLLMPKTRNHVYYYFTSGVVEVIAVENAKAGSTPEF